MYRSHPHHVPAIAPKKISSTSSLPSPSSHLRSLYTKQGLSTRQLQEELHNESIDKIAEIVNKLLRHHRIQMFEKQGSKVHYFRTVRPEESAKFKHLTAEDILVYQTIQESKNMGIWTRDVKNKTNLTQPKITKTLKVLEERKLVKSVKNVQNASRKMYMLYSLEPAREVTGGPWYGGEGGNFDAGFAQDLRDVAEQYVERRGQPTLRSIAKHIINSKVSNIKLTIDDVAAVVNSLVYDGKLEEVPRKITVSINEDGEEEVDEDTDIGQGSSSSSSSSDSDDEDTVTINLEDDEDGEEDEDGDGNGGKKSSRKRKAAVGKKKGKKPKPLRLVSNRINYQHARRRYVKAVVIAPEETPMTDIPCGVCPVFADCQEGGVVSPSKCHYYREWLDF